ncbi:hypothetical protein [Amycolatopsis anabasis]|uniref:hypothetical protein n=1 Tax=Amycolatopsis anabasis TaxID=1840409 RepID=UPI00131BAA59|nr:hypothetical protein [Amycolatopsis anabasis]
MTLTGGREHWAVRAAERAPDGAAFAPWVERNFTAAGATQVTGQQGSWEHLAQPSAEARRALGLPPEAPLEEPA